MGLPLVSGRQVRVGWLWPNNADDPQVVASLNLFRSTMAQHGWVEGRNLTIVERYNQGHADLIPKLASELASMPLDAVVTNGAVAVRALKDASPSIPIVMIAGPSDCCQGRSIGTAGTREFSAYAQQQQEPDGAGDLEDAVDEPGSRRSERQNFVVASEHWIQCDADARARGCHHQTGAAPR
jgi:hypothetical protein